MKREIFYRSHRRTLELLRFGFPSVILASIHLRSNAFLLFVMKNSSRLNWAMCVAESLFVFLLKEKIVTRENSIQPVLLHTCNGPRQTLTHHVRHIQSDSPTAPLPPRTRSLKCWC